MTEGQTVIDKKKRRVPKPGTWFGILRVTGIILEIIGGVITVASVVGFIVLLIKTGPDLIAILTSSSVSQMAGFYLILLLTWLAVPLFTGLIGIVMAVVGFVFYLLATTRSVSLPGA